jgi:hypothetical protein
MKNIFKIAVLLIACSGTFAANNTIHNVILNEFSTLNTSTKGFNTDPKKKILFSTIKMQPIFLSTTILRVILYYSSLMLHQIS